MTPDRGEAARLLRAIRRAGPDHADDLVDWAFSLMPHRRQARRLKVEQLLTQGDLDGADALIAQALRHERSVGFVFLHARSLSARGDKIRAWTAVRSVLEQRPCHRPALELATELAIRAGRAREVVGWLERALARRDDAALRKLLTRALLADGQTERAGEVLASLGDTEPLLLARIRRQQGRRLEAFEILERAHAEEPDDARRDALLADQLELLEAIGDRAHLESMIARLDATTPRAMLGGATALLALGNFRAARRTVTEALRIPMHRWRALHVMVVAAALDHRPLLARQALDRLRQTHRGIDTDVISEAWRRGILGAITQKHESAVRAGTDPSPGVLGALLQRASRVFEVELASACSEARHERMRDCRNRCRLALSAR